ncbi:diguanylate cyclase [Cyanobium sp. T1G-Tous]|uniref:sensor domain-containing diguanylate cyclase n=1 Tax=Cyanobium sp. T1G-Tous TaxID=2823722 RepID=UPI0020CC80B2|nr:diguanylate cyclase [Cyanobium sp. T1G-Tous]MCP9802292.1 diguanylate cyclase [Cyanobium sp. T1G-Tous]
MAIRVRRAWDHSLGGMGALEEGRSPVADRPATSATCKVEATTPVSNNGDCAKIILRDSSFQRLIYLRHQYLAQHVLDVIWTMDFEGRFTYISPSVRAIRGWSPKELMNMPLDRQLTPESLKTLRTHLLRARNLAVIGCPVRIETQIEEYCKDGSTVWMDIKAAYAIDRFGKCCELVGISRDITKEKQLKDELLLEEQQHILLGEEIPQATWTMLVNGKIKFVSPSIKKLCGIAPAEFTRRGLAQIHPPDSLQRIQDYLTKINRLNGKCNSLATYRGELEYWCKDGSTAWAEVVAIPILNRDGRIKHLLGVSHDITKRRMYEEQLRLSIQNLSDLALKDGLTGVWNRRHLESVIGEAVANSDRYGDILTLVLCDIDCFKSINDCHGHLVGDQVLMEFAQRISSCLRDGDSFGRWGGEEFLVLLPRGDYRGASILAEKLRRCIADDQFSGAGKVTASFGVAQRYLNESALEWFRRVDEQLYNAKRSGRNCVMAAPTFANH